MLKQRKPEARVKDTESRMWEYNQQHSNSIFLQYQKYGLSNMKLLIISSIYNVERKQMLQVRNSALVYF